ncbi:MAG: multidrug effflux MFS transporter [Alicyclobacillaceae bacterium]|nr:multidrug effflux MFS transporter [Alicyclobacillaceae bacterium]
MNSNPNLCPDQVGTAVVRPAVPSRLRLAVILGALAALGPLSIDMYLPALPTLARELHAHAASTQMTLTGCMLGLAIGQWVAGPWSDSLGRRRPLLVGLCGYAAASLLCAAAPSVWILAVLRFIQGLAGAAGIVIARAVARDAYTGLALTRFFALMMVVNGAAPVLAPVLGGQILAFTSWRGVFLVLGLCGLALVLSVWLGLPETLPPERRAAGGARGALASARTLVRDTSFMGLTLTQALVFSGMFSYISASSFVFQSEFHVSPQTYSVIFAVNGMGIVIAGQIAGWLSGRLGERRVLTASVLWAVGSSLAVVLAAVCRGGLFAVWVPLFAAVSCIGSVGTTAPSLAMQGKGEAAGSAAAFLGVVQMFLGALVAPVVGLGGMPTALWMGTAMAGCDLLALTAFLMLVRRGAAHGA